MPKLHILRNVISNQLRLGQRFNLGRRESLQTQIAHRGSRQRLRQRQIVEAYLQLLVAQYVAVSGAGLSGLAGIELRAKSIDMA